jgi:O-antigen/teichoic acid export membrane protein
VALSLKEKMFGGVLWSGAGKIVSMAANFVITLVLARALAPTDYGTYFVALTTIVIVASVGTLGMDQIVVRFAATKVAANDLAGARQVATRCLGIVLIGTVATCAIFLLLGPAFFRNVLDMPRLATCLGVLGAWLLFATLQRQLAETFRGLNDIRRATLFGGVRNSGIVNAALACVGMLVAWVGGFLNLLTALLIMMGASVIVVTVASITLWKCLRHSPSADGIVEVQSLATDLALREGWPLWLATLVAVLNSVGSGWLAGALDTSAHVALFGVAQRFVLLLLAPMVVINAVLPPIVSQLHASMQFARLEKIVRSIGGLLLLPMLGVLALLVVGGKPLLHVLFGAYYENAYAMLLILCLGQVVNIATGAWQIVLPMTGQRHQMLAASGVSVIVQFVLGVVLGHWFGVLGVAIAFCASTVITNLLGVVLVYRQLGIWTYATVNRRAVQDVNGMILARLSRRTAWQKS